MKKHNLFIFAILFVLCMVANMANAQTVYVTSGGKKYHKKNCSVVNEGKKGIELSEAKKQGYTPCAVCKPDEKAAPATPKEEPKKKK